MLQEKKYTLDFAGRMVTATFSDLAPQAHGSVMLECDGTVVLATVVMGSDGAKNPGYFNLTVEYMERFYAAGKICGAQYTHREGKPSNSAVLASRIIDRTLRPLFDQRIREAIQIVVTVLSLGDMDPVVLAVNAASLALSVSPIPHSTGIGCVRVGSRKSEGSKLTNVYFKNELIDENASVDLLVCGTGEKVTMIESGCDELAESEMMEYFQMTIEPLKQWNTFQASIVTEIGQIKKQLVFPELNSEIQQYCDEKMKPIIATKLFGDDSKKRLAEIIGDWTKLFSEFTPSSETFIVDDVQKKLAMDYIDTLLDTEIHRYALTEKKRVDLRALDQIRTLFAQVGGVSPRLHGSGIFYRGETHVLSVVTLAGPDSNLVHEGMEVSGEQRFFHHYNFPPYSVGETGRIGFTGRREIGHGALAEKALSPVIPNIDVFPYTIRIVSECVSSNGSTSQASICASTLALMDAGVPIVRPVVGISIGLILDEVDSNNFVLLTDIQGPEDHFGDMDFKVAGTEKGITAIQMDIKLSGVSYTIVSQALSASRLAHNDILKTVIQEIATPRAQLSVYAPRIVTLIIDPDMIGKVIGSGGKTIQKIQKDTETKIGIEDDGRIFITGFTSGPEMAKTIIESMTKVWAIGDKVTGTIVKILDDTGAITEIAPGVTGMIHISEISSERIDSVSAKLTLGQSVEVVVVSVDPERDRIGLSMKRVHDAVIETESNDRQNSTQHRDGGPRQQKGSPRPRDRRHN